MEVVMTAWAPRVKREASSGRPTMLGRMTAQLRRFSAFIGLPVYVTPAVQEDLKRTGNRVTKPQRGGEVILSHHVVDMDTVNAFAQYINVQLGKDPMLQHILPIERPAKLFTAARDGILLCKLLNLVDPEAIDDRVINVPDDDGKPLSVYEVNENLDLALGAARACGIKVVNVGAQDIMEGNQHLILGLVWQIVREIVLTASDLRRHPHLELMAQQGETAKSLRKLRREELLLRWVNFQTGRFCAGGSPWAEPRAGLDPKQLTADNFASALQDGAALATLVAQLVEDRVAGKSGKRPRDADMRGGRRQAYLGPPATDEFAASAPRLLPATFADHAALVNAPSPSARAKYAVKGATLLGAQLPIQPHHIDGSGGGGGQGPNEHMTLCFVATLCAAQQSLFPPAAKPFPPGTSPEELAAKEKEAAAAAVREAAAAEVFLDPHVQGKYDEQSHEERLARLWLLSLGLPSLAEDDSELEPLDLQDLAAAASDGRLILEAMDFIDPGCVDWSKVDQDKDAALKPAELTKMRTGIGKDARAKGIKSTQQANAVGNCDYVVALAKDNFGMQLPGIAGKDFAERGPTAVLALVWQLMRWQVARVLSLLLAAGGDGNGDGVVSDDEILEWAMVTARHSGLLGAKTSHQPYSHAVGLKLKEEAEYVFALADRDGNGTLDADEVLRVMLKDGTHEIDTNDDGVISSAEWLTWVRKQEDKSAGAARLMLQKFSVSLGGLTTFRSLKGSRGSAHGGSRQTHARSIFGHRDDEHHEPPIQSFKDKSLASGYFLLELLKAVDPERVDLSRATPGASDPADQKANARYALSLARRMGCPVFLTWEDIVQVQPKMIQTLVAAIMAKALGAYEHHHAGPDGHIRSDTSLEAQGAFARCLVKCLPARDGDRVGRRMTHVRRAEAAEALSAATRASAEYIQGRLSQEEAKAAHEEALAHGGGDDLFKAWSGQRRRQ